MTEGSKYLHKKKKKCALKKNMFKKRGEANGKLPPQDIHVNIFSCVSQFSYCTRICITDCK